MKFKFLLSVFLMMAASAVVAQNLNLNRAYIVSGGQYSNTEEHVAVGYYDYASEGYVSFDSIYTQSTQDALVDGDVLYVTAQDTLVSYDLNTMERIATKYFVGLNNLAVSDDKLLLSLQYPVETESLLILEKETLETSAIIELSGEAADIIVDYDSAYVAVPGSWGTEEGRLAVIDLSTETLTREINFGADAKGLKELFLKNGVMYTVNTHFSDYTLNTFSVSTFNLWTEEIVTTTYSGDYYGYYGNSVMSDEYLFIPASMTLAKVDLATMDIDMDFMTIYPASIAYDEVDENLHITTSDFANYGNYQVYNQDGELISDEIAVGTSPEAIALQYDVSNEFTTDEIDFWVGTGSNEVVLVIDWNDALSPESMAWGYRFDGSLTAEEMISAISETDAFLDVTIGAGFLNDIVYDGDTQDHSGLAGNPDYWSTWSRTEATAWAQNLGLSESLEDGDRFGCSYGFTPEATAPDVPEAAPVAITSLEAIGLQAMKIFNAFNQLNIQSDQSISQVAIYSVTGQMLKNVRVSDQTQVQISTQHMIPGVYMVRVAVNDQVVTRKVVIN